MLIIKDIHYMKAKLEAMFGPDYLIFERWLKTPTNGVWIVKEFEDKFKGKLHNVTVM